MPHGFLGWGTLIRGTFRVRRLPSVAGSLPSTSDCVPILIRENMWPLGHRLGYEAAQSASLGKTGWIAEFLRPGEKPLVPG